MVKSVLYALFFTLCTGYCDKITVQVHPYPYISIVNRGAVRIIADTVGVDAALLEAVVYVESRGNALAVRFEKKLTREQWYITSVGKYQGVYSRLKYCSLGAAQVLYGVAQERGYRGSPEGLLDPYTGIYWGAVQLAYLIDRHGNTWDAVSAYNQGYPRKRKDGTYLNAWYVAEVKRRYEENIITKF